MSKELDIANHITHRVDTVGFNIAVVEAIAKYIPSIAVLQKATNYILKGRYGIIDSTDKGLSNKCRKAWRMSNEQSKDAEYILDNIKDNVPKAQIQAGTRVTTDNSSYGNGVVVKIFSDNNQCLVDFEKKRMSIMCSITTKKTVHLESDNIKIQF